MSKAQIGKRVFDDLYIHLSASECIEQDEHRVALRQALQLIPVDGGIAPNVAKLNIKTGRLSLLAYNNFETEPFPRLLASWSFAAGLAAPPIYRTYESSLNPPILHRKELLVPPSYPGRDKWVQLTGTAEALGLFDDTGTIGFRQNWDRLIRSKGYRLIEYEFQPIGNEILSDEGGLTPDAKSGPVQRHLTALTRNSLSAPVQLLLRHGLLEPSLSFFDYGCGRGGDVAALASSGFDASGWDPHFAPDHAISKADTVNLGFVVNVIEDPAERVEALHKAFALTNRVLSIGVMLYSGDLPGKPFHDGFITSRNTFQKYFSQGELKDYIEQVLHHEAFMVAPGIAFVFADKDLQQRFCVERYRTSDIALRLLAANRPRVVRIPSESKRQRTSNRQSVIDCKYEVAGPLLDRLWTLCLELGRYPEADEVTDLQELQSALGSLAMTLRYLADRYDQTLLRSAQRTRKDDLRLFFAMQQFDKRPQYRSLEIRLQRDIKSFFGDYRIAQEEGLKLLVEAADVSKIREACSSASELGLGLLQGQQSLLLHLSLVERLPVVLRAYVGCGLILYNAISEVQIIKIHINSGKLTLLQYDDFDGNAVPVLAKRIKVNIRKQDYEVFEYGSSQHPKQMLAWKSRYINEDTPGYAEQQLFDEQLESAGLLPDPEHGHFPEEMLRTMNLMRLQVEGLRLVRSVDFPDIDQKCGLNLTYRTLIECGETQQRVKIANLPRKAASYNALYDLASKLLDPIIDYFGSIQLTYAFCSPELSKHILSRVAPKLDQHAAHEVDRKGNLICNRQGAACDFIVEDENMREVADWVITNVPFDRLYFYGEDRPIHLSFGPQNSCAAYAMIKTASGATLPRRYEINQETYMQGKISIQ